MGMAPTIKHGVTLQSAILNIGATSDTVQRGESARRRKFIQLDRKKLSHYEPALKVFRPKRILEWYPYCSAP